MFADDTAMSSCSPRGLQHKLNILRAFCTARGVNRAVKILVSAKFRWLLCQRSFPIMRRLFDAVVLPTVSYGSEAWGPSCSPSLPRDIKKMAEDRLAFFRKHCRLKKSGTHAIISRELSVRPWVHRWWNQVIGFVHRLSNMPDDGIHAEILRMQPLQHSSCWR